MCEELNDESTGSADTKQYNQHTNGTTNRDYYFYQDDNDGDEEGDRCILSQCVIS